VTAWTCPSCRKIAATPFCANCGEERVKAQHLSLRQLSIELFHTLTDVDSRMLRSVRLLLLRPGALTHFYVQGSHKPYFGPFQLFLIANLLFFTVQSLSAQKIFATPLASHLHNQDWSALARELTSDRLARTGVALEPFEAVFDRVVAANAKSLVVLMAIPFVLLLPLLYRRGARPVATHIVFTLHFYSFLLLLFCAATLLAMCDGWLGKPLASRFLDPTLFVLLLVGALVYLLPAVGRVYGDGGAPRVLRVLVLVLCVGTAMQAYRFALFLITLYTN
jgi:Protein of unknown function (DUF3667)